MLKSIKLLKNEKYKDFLACVDKRTLNMSDFEKFAFSCENLSCMLGSDFRNGFLRALSEDLNTDILPAALKGRENQKHIWRAMHGYSKVALTLEEKEIKTVMNIDRSTPRNLNSLLLGENITAEIDSLAEQISEDIVVDISNLKYLRPDEYHSSLAYRKIRNGESCSSEELCALLCWIICRALMKRDLRVYVVADKPMTEVEKVLHLFNDRKLYPDIRLCFYPSKEAVEKAAGLCLGAPQKNISPEIIIPEDRDVIENIVKLFCKIPASRIYLCGFMTNEKGTEQFKTAFNLMLEEK